MGSSWADRTDLPKQEFSAAGDAGSPRPGAAGSGAARETGQGGCSATPTFSSLALALDGLLSREANASVITYLSACAINLLVPSGGGQWAVQSPIILEMSKSLGIERAPLVMAFAYGDQTTNLLQPFWALPLLSISGLKARDIMGFTMVALVVEMAIVVPCLVIFSD